MENLELVSTPRAAELLGVKRNTLEIWRYRGTGPRFVKIGRCVRYKMLDLQDFIESGGRTSTGETDNQSAVWPIKN